MTILHLILAWVAVFIGYVVFLRIRENARVGRKLLDFGKSNFLLASIAVLASSWIAITIVRPEPTLNTAEEKIAFGDATRQPWISNEGLWEKIIADSATIDDHFQLVRNHYAQLKPDLKPPSAEAYRREEEKMYTWYSEMSRSEETLEHDIGHIMLADMFISQSIPDYAAASDQLRVIDDPTTKYVNYQAARVMLFGAGSSLAEEHLYSEIRNKGYKKGAYEYLALLFHMQGEDSLLRKLVYSSAAAYIAPEIRSEVYFRDRDILQFFALKFQTLLGSITWWGLAGGFAILGVWLYVLSALGRVTGIRFHHLIIPLLGGAASCVIAWWLYAQYRFGFGFSLNGNLLNDFIFSVTGIGIIEELVKLIPFLCILFFTSVMRKPLDYLLVASACGLGFAVFENLMYISGYGLDVIHSRALTSSVSHMACSGIVAYGFVLWRFRWKKHFWLVPLFFLLASAAHGFYDFWLLNEQARVYGIITLFFYLSLIVVYFSFLNNAMNQSVAEEEVNAMVRFDAGLLTSVFAGAMVLLFTFEYIALVAVYGTHYGNTAMMNAFLAGGYLVFFLSVRLSQLRIEPQRWKRIDILSGLLPGRMFSEQREETEEA